MLQEINQRKNKEIIFRCHCGGDHFVSFSIYKDENMKEFYVNVFDQADGILERIKKAMKFIFLNKKIYYCDVGLTMEDLKRVLLLIDEYSNFK